MWILPRFSLHTKATVHFICPAGWVLVVVSSGLFQRPWHRGDGSEGESVYERQPALQFSRLGKKKPKKIKPLNAIHGPSLAPTKNTVGTSN